MHFLIIWLLPVLVGALVGFLVAGKLGVTGVRLLLGASLFVMIASFLLATTSDDRAWAVIPYFVSLGLSVGLLTQMLGASRLIAAIAALAAACAGLFLLFQLGCTWGGQCM